MSQNIFHTSRRNLLKLGAATAAMPFLARMGHAAGPIKTAAIYTVPVEQQWVSRIHKAATIAKDRGDIEYVFSEKVANTDYERVMREYCEAGYKLILGEAFAVEEAARAVAKDYPNVAFLIGSSFKPDAALPNFATFDNYIQDASYLSGMIAGAMTKSNTLGVVASIPIPEVIRNINSFTLGAQSVNPKVKTKVVWVNEWFNPPKETEAATSLINGGADILFQNTDSPAVLKTAEAKGKRAFGWVRT